MAEHFVFCKNKCIQLRQTRRIIWQSLPLALWTAAAEDLHRQQQKQQKRHPRQRKDRFFQDSFRCHLREEFRPRADKASNKTTGKADNAAIVAKLKLTQSALHSSAKIVEQMMTKEVLRSAPQMICGNSLQKVILLYQPM